MMFISGLKKGKLVDNQGVNFYNSGRIIATLVQGKGLKKGKLVDISQ